LLPLPFQKRTFNDTGFYGLDDLSVTKPTVECNEGNRLFIVASTIYRERYSVVESIAFLSSLLTEVEHLCWRVVGR